MSAFTDSMIDDGFSDPQEYMDYLMNKAEDYLMDNQNDDDWSEDYEQDDYNYSDEGCGEGFSCSQCDNYGCPAHPCN